jgi:small-conductance mechanosensitive channel
MVSLFTVPNSAITQVKNLTRSWSRVAFQIDVAYQTDPRLALQVLQDLSEKFYNDPEWHDQMVAEPEVLGIDSVTHSGMTITVWIRTQPAQQWAVGASFGCGYGRPWRPTVSRLAYRNKLINLSKVRLMTMAQIQTYLTWVEFVALPLT